MSDKIGLAFAFVCLLSTLQPIKFKGKKQCIENYIECNQSSHIDKPFTIADTSILIGDEKSYIKTRDRMIHFFKIHPAKRFDDKIYKQQEDSLKLLERSLKFIFKSSPLSIQLSNDSWKINLETLYDELGFGMLDGLNNFKTINDTTNIFYTSNILFYNYFKKDTINSTDNLTSKQLEKIINAAFYSDAYFTKFITYKLPSTTNIHVYAIIGTGTNDIPLSPPNELAIIVFTDKYLYIINKYLHSNQITGIPECEKICTNFYNNEGQNKNMKEWDKQLDKATEKYCNCYLEKLKYSGQYPRVQKMIDGMYEELKREIQ